MKRFIIAGPGEFGSKYIFFLFQLLDLNIGQEQLFSSAHRTRDLPEWNYGIIGEISWKATPYWPLIHKEHPDIVLFYQDQHRDKVIEGLLNDELFYNFPQLDDYEHTSFWPLIYWPEIRDMKTTRERIEYFYDRCREIGYRYADMTYHISDLNADLIMKILRIIDAPPVYLNEDLINQAINFLPKSVERPMTFLSVERINR